MTWLTLQRRKKEANAKLKEKLELAKLRKHSLQREQVLARNDAAIDHFKKHWMFREEVLQKTMELFKEYEEIKQENIEVIMS